MNEKNNIENKAVDLELIDDEKEIDNDCIYEIIDFLLKEKLIESIDEF